MESIEATVEFNTQLIRIAGILFPGFVLHATYTKRYNIYYLNIT